MKFLKRLFFLFACLISVSSLSAQNLPQALVLGDTAFCVGDSTQLFATPGSFPRYQWSTGDTTPTIFVKTGGTYTVRVVDSLGNLGPVSRNQVVISLALPPKPTITGAASFCENGSTLLTGLPNTYPKYLWSRSSTDTLPGIRTSVAGTFSVQAIDSEGCVSIPSDPISVTENPLPPRPVIRGDSAICEGDSALVGVLQPFYQNYSWSNGESAQSIWVKTGGPLTLAVTDSNGCESPLSDTFMVRESMRPISPAIGGDTVFCAGDSLQLFGPAGFTAYLWSTGDTSPAVWVNASGAYALRVTNAAGCISPFSLPWQINELPIPTLPSISPFGADSLHANSLARKYIWLRNGQPLADSTEIIAASQSGVYRVIALNGECQSDTSAAFSFVKTALEDKEKGSFALFPNPAQEQLFVLLPEAKQLLLPFSIMDIQGRKIESGKLPLDASGLGSITLEGFSNGYYFLRIGSQWQKFLIKK